MDNTETVKQDLLDLETRLDSKLNIIMTYKSVSVTFKLITFMTLACFIFFKSGRSHDIFLWFIGFFMLLVAVGEFIELNEISAMKKLWKK